MSLVLGGRGAGAAFGARGRFVAPQQSSVGSGAWFGWCYEWCAGWVMVAQDGGCSITWFGLIPCPWEGCAGWRGGIENLKQGIFVALPLSGVLRRKNPDYNTGRRADLGSSVKHVPGASRCRVRGTHDAPVVLWAQDPCTVTLCRGVTWAQVATSSCSHVASPETSAVPPKHNVI